MYTDALENTYKGLYKREDAEFTICGNFFTVVCTCFPHSLQHKRDILLKFQQQKNVLLL